MITKDMPFFSINRFEMNPENYKEMIKDLKKRLIEIRNSVIKHGKSVGNSNVITNNHKTISRLYLMVARELIVIIDKTYTRSNRYDSIQEEGKMLYEIKGIGEYIRNTLHLTLPNTRLKCTIIERMEYILDIIDVTFLMIEYYEAKMNNREKYFEAGDSLFRIVISHKDIEKQRLYIKNSELSGEESIIAMLKNEYKYISKLLNEIVSEKHVTIKSVLILLNELSNKYDITITIPLDRELIIEAEKELRKFIDGKIEKSKDGNNLSNLKIFVLYLKDNIVSI